jgi:hypothetical protein
MKRLSFHGMSKRNKAEESPRELLQPDAKYVRWNKLMLRDAVALGWCKVIGNGDALI